MVEFCTSENIILQTVVAYNHTMQARVEGAIGYVKQHSRVALLAANAPTRYWPHATTDFVQKKNYLWYTERQPGVWSTAHQRMRPSFAGTRSTVAIPFGSRIVSKLPREHRRVVNGSYGDRFVEGIYLYADAQTPTIRMFDLVSRTELSVKDFTSYPSDFPFHDPTCLTRSPESLRKALADMHTEDETDDQLIAEELKEHAITRSQTHAHTRAKENPLIQQQPIVYTPSPVQANVAATGGAPAKSVDKWDVPLAELQELDLARSFVKLKLPILLPLRYNPVIFDPK